MGSLDFLEALLTENRMLDLVLIANYNKEPIACFNFVGLNFFDFNILFLIGIVFEVGLCLFISNLFNISSKYFF